MGLSRILPRSQPRLEPVADEHGQEPEPGVEPGIQPGPGPDLEAAPGGPEEPEQDSTPEQEQGAHLRAVPSAEDESQPRRRERVMANVIVFANQKGGVAKTTTTLNLGVALRELGHDVLIIDLDPQGNLTMSQGMNPDAIERSMFDVLVHRVPISDVVHTVEVDIAVASIDLAGA
ncbi:MAG TPA: AAA family ATPase, partial [Gaiellaceae bacterium]|nr:AAA family ATPase [Gaiellaceae bacterium]